MENKKKFPIEKTYFVLKEYLKDIQHPSAFPRIDETIKFDEIGKYIDNSGGIPKLHKDFSEEPIEDLINQLAIIVYLSDLSYYYIQNSGFLYAKIIQSLSISKNRLEKIRQCLNDKISLFKNHLQSLLEENNEDASLTALAKTYVCYLETIENAKITPLAKYAGSLVGEINFQLIRTEAKKNRDLIHHLSKKKPSLNLEEDEFYDAIEFEADQFFDKKEEEDEFFDAMENFEDLQEQRNDSSKLSFFQRLLNWFKRLRHLLHKAPHHQANKSNSTHYEIDQEEKNNSDENKIVSKPIKNNTSCANLFQKNKVEKSIPETASNIPAISTLLLN